MNIAIRTAYIGAAAVVAAAAITVLGPRVVSLFETSSLELADLVVDEDGKACKLDFKLQNRGSRSAFITRAEFRVTKVWELNMTFDYVSYVRPSQTYQVALPVRGAPYTLQKDISQTVEPGNSDRFFMTVLGGDWKLPAKEFVFAVGVTLLYDANRKSLNTGTLLFSSRGDLKSDLSQYAMPSFDLNKLRKQGSDPVLMDTYESWLRSVESNAQTIAEIAKVIGKRSPRVIKLIEGLREKLQLVAPAPQK